MMNQLPKFTLGSRTARYGGYMVAVRLIHGFEPCSKYSMNIVQCLIAGYHIIMIALVICLKVEKSCNKI